MMSPMQDDIYYDCPACRHTMLLSPDQVGKTVECPDCRYEVMVPDIREGLNPRLRSLDAGDVSPERVPTGLADCRTRLDTLEEGFRNLTLKNEVRVEEMTLMHKSAELLHRQLGLLNSESLGLSGDSPADETAPPPKTVFWGTVTLGLCLATLLAASLAASFIFRN